MKDKYLIDIYERERNSYNDLRFWLAFMILVAHSYDLLYNFGRDPITILMGEQSSLGCV